MGNRNEYVRNVARTMAGSLGLQLRFVKNHPRVADDLLASAGGAIRTRLKRWSDESLGRVAACGRAFGDPFDGRKAPHSLYAVHCSDWLDKYASGRDLLEAIAATAIIAAMCDLVREYNELGAAMCDLQRVHHEIEERAMASIPDPARKKLDGYSGILGPDRTKG